jgi:hypothetical protein
MKEEQTLTMKGSERTMSKAKLIRVLERFSGVTDKDVDARGNTVQTSMTGNTHCHWPW